MLNEQIIKELEISPLAESIGRVAELFPGQVAFSSSLGQEDQVLADIIFGNNLAVRVFTIDTGRLFNESYELLERTIARYKKPIDVFFPQAEGVQSYVAEHGINGFYESVENRKTCCYIRKVEPLNRALRDVKVWITGLRADQSDNRRDMPMIEWNEERQLYKFNPLIRWSYDEMLDYLRQHNVPYNRLHDRGFISIGCAPCTRAIRPGEDFRAGRWWWEDATKKECGLHEVAVKSN